MIDKFNEMSGMTVTFNVTEDCNLRCTYCYEINKCKKDLSLEYAKKFIDIVLSDPDPTGAIAINHPLSDRLKRGLILDFIGGDALMCIDLLEQIINYYLLSVHTKKVQNINYISNFKMSISTNGTLFSDPKVRAFCEKYKYILSPSVSIDGCKEIHDKCRIYNPELTGGVIKGTYDDIKANWDWYKRNFPTESLNTKSTLAKQSIPYLYDSLKALHEDFGLKYINQNYVMEDTHLTDEDYILFDSEMRKCVEYVLVHCDDLYWSMISDQFANHCLSSGDDWSCRGHCGSGSMPCLGINGNIYPCFRWAPHTQPKDKPEPIVVGNVHKGMYNKAGFELVRKMSTRDNCTKDSKCRTCIYESACSYCIGGCYAETGDFIRLTHICEITKIQSKWAKVYWNEYNKLKGIPLEYNELFTLDRVPAWTKEMSTIDELDF